MGDADSGLIDYGSGRVWVARWITAVALVLCGIVAFGHLWASAWACGAENTYCAVGHHKNGFYAGVLRQNYDGRPLRNREFAIYFDSVAGPVSGFSTDAEGRYCIRWAAEYNLPDWDDRDPGLNDARPLADWESDKAARVPEGCQTGNAGISWHRANDLTSAWQYISVFVVMAAAALLLVLGHAVRRVPLRRVLWRAGICLSLGGAVWVFVAWQL